MEVIVPDDQLSLAIGRNGQNVRLAVRLTGWKIDVKSESTEAEQAEKGYKSLMQIQGIGEVTAELLFNEGFKNVESLSQASPDMLTMIPKISEKKALAWIEEAGKIVNGGTIKKEEQD